MSDSLTSFVFRSGVPPRQRPLHTRALRLPWRLLHVFSRQHDGQQRGEHVGSHLRRGVQPLRQHALHTCGRTRDGEPSEPPPQRGAAQRGGQGVRGRSVEGGADRGVFIRQASAAFGEEQAGPTQRRGGAEQVHPERAAAVPGHHRAAVRPAAAAHHAHRVRPGHCLPERHPQDA